MVQRGAAGDRRGTAVDRARDRGPAPRPRPRARPAPSACDVTRPTDANVTDFGARGRVTRGSEAVGLEPGAGSPGDVPEVVDDVVQEVARERVDRELRAVAAPAGALPLLAATPAKPSAIASAASASSAGDDGGVLLVVALLDARWRPGPSWRTAGRPRSSMSRAGGSNTGSTSRTWQAYSSGDQTSGPGARRASAAASAAPSSPRCRAARVGDVGGRRPCWRRSRTRGTAARPPRSSPWCPARWSCSAANPVRWLPQRLPTTSRRERTPDVPGEPQSSPHHSLRVDMRVVSVRSSQQGPPSATPTRWCPAACS